MPVKNKIDRGEVEKITDAPNAELISLKISDISDTDKALENVTVSKSQFNFMIEHITILQASFI